MNKLNFIIGIHDHQPVGNFDFVFEHSYEHAYKPFIDVMMKHQKVKANLHFTGILLEWIYKKHPDFFDNLRYLINNNQLEILTGGYYEPIMPLIPEKDRIGQIRKLTSFIEEKLDYHPKGMWLAERVWEQNLVSSLVEAGVEYVLLDDSHFIKSGIPAESLNGYFTTEDQGKTLKMFPIDKQSRYLIPFSDHNEVMDYFREKADDTGQRLLLMADDGEKFGDWPGTFHSVYEEEWLHRFFILLSSNSDWISSLFLSEYIDLYPSNGVVYINNASYSEMMEWALPAQFQDDMDFLKTVFKDQDYNERFNMHIGNGYFRNFLFKYSESNNMHKKMLIVHDKVHNMPEGPEKEKALSELWAGQCNCPYWHGVFGGLYLPHLRNAIYESLIKAEKYAETNSGATGGTEFVVRDLDLDGNEEIEVITPSFRYYIDPAKGGMIYNDEILESELNIANGLTRREEFYHKKLQKMIAEGRVTNDPTDSDGKVVVKEPDLQNILKYDWHQRGSLIDHFLHPETDLYRFQSVDYGEEGDFVLAEYKRKISGDDNTLILSRNGHVWVEGNFEPVFVEKRVRFIEDGLDISYSIRNDSSNKISLWHAVEFMASLMAGHAPDRYYFGEDGRLDNGHLDSVHDIKETKMIGITDEYYGIDIIFETNIHGGIWAFPLETVSLSESGFEKNYQASLVVLNQKITLAPDQQFNYNIKRKIVKR